MSDDIEVIRQVVAGDVQAFRALVERYQRPLFCMIRGFVGDRDDAEDIAQEVFLAAFRHLPRFQPGRAQFSTWLFSIARNKCINSLKRKRPVAMAEVPDQFVDQRPEQAVADQEMFDRFDATLAELPLEQRSALLLSEMEGLPYEQIALIEGTPIGTVRSRIARAKRKLRALLEQTTEQTQ